jgi:hypothetical protein
MSYWIILLIPLINSLFVTNCRGSLPLTVNLYQIMCPARMVSTRDTGVYTGSSLRGVILYIQCRAVVFLR